MRHVASGLQLLGLALLVYAAFLLDSVAGWLLLGIAILIIGVLLESPVEGSEGE